MEARRDMLISFMGTSHNDTVYTFGGKEIAHTEYILEVLLALKQPDTVVLYGSQGSKWDDLCRHVTGHALPDSLAEQLLDDKNLSGQDLDALSTQLSSCFQRYAGKGMLSHVTSIDVRLIRFGITPDINPANYEILAADLRARLSGSTATDVSVDITHSFRSFPFFTYSVLEYLRCILPDDVRIQHIFYGEQNKDRSMTAIQDLIMVRDVQALTHAVEEFKHTGRTAALAVIFKDQDSELYQALDNFDWAMQCNAIDKMSDAIGTMLDETEPGSYPLTPYADARALLGAALRKALFASDICENSSTAWRNLDLPHQRLLLCKMLCEFNSLGQAALVGTELLWAALEPVYRDNTSADLIPGSEYALFNQIKKVLDYLKRKKIPVEFRNTPAAKVLSSLHSSYNTLNEFRKTVAHNKADSENAYSEETIRTTINAFCTHTDSLLACLASSSGAQCSCNYSKKDIMDILKIAIQKTNDAVRAKKAEASQ